MPKALSEADRALIADLRHEGLSNLAVSLIVGVSVHTAKKYSPPARDLRVVSKYTRHDWINREEGEYADVVPIPFFPDDLPRLEKDPFWTPARLEWAIGPGRKKRSS